MRAIYRIDRRGVGYGASMSDTEQNIVDADLPEGPMAVVVTEPTGIEAKATVVAFMDAPGIRPSLKEFSHRLAAEGYRVVLPDLYHRGGRLLGWEPAEATDEDRAHMLELFHSLTDAGIQADLDAALVAVGAQDETGMGTIGFCLGARAVYRTLMRLPEQFAAGAMWHPSLLVDEADDSPHLTARSLAQPLYIGIGTADQVQSIDMQRSFFDVAEPLEHVDLTIFEGADHAFTWPTGPTYHEVAATESWAKTTALFSTTLG